MSLIHWWPLTTDLKDYCATKATITNRGSVAFTGAGKLGPTGATFTTDSQSLRVSDLATLNSMTEYSFSCWVYLTGTGTYNKTMMFLSSGNFNTAKKYITFGVSNYSSNGYTILNVPTPNGCYVGINLAAEDYIKLNKWYHIAICYKNNRTKGYINGKYVGECTGHMLPSTEVSYYYIGAATYYAGFGLRGILNDFKIFDHALSQAEVKELAKALVVHYTFDDICAEPTTNVSTISGWNSYTSYFVISERTETGLKVYRPTNSTNTVLALSNSAVTGKMAAGEIWTFSCYLYIDGKPYKCTQPDMSTYQYSGINYYSNDDGYYTCTFTVGTPEAWIIHAPMFGSVGTNVMCEIDKIQFEKKDHATPYTPTNREGKLVNEAGYLNPSSVADLKLSTDAASGSYSLKCAGTTYLKHTPAGDGSNATASFWLKNFDTSGQMVVFADANSKLAFGPYSTYTCISCKSGVSSQVLTSEINKYWKTADWNHVVVRKNSSNEYSCFINGTKVTNTTGDYWTHDTYLSIGCRISGNVVGRQVTGLIDDFRLYHTYLTDNDIVALYKTKAYITDKGDIISGEFIENKADVRVTKKYTTEALEFIEDFAVNNEYERVEYLEFSEKEYIDTGLAFPNENIPIIIEADIVKTVLSSNDCLAGCGNSAWTGPIMLNCHRGTCEFGVNGYATASDGSGSFAAGERFIIRAEIGTKSTEHNWYKNGIKINLGSNAYRDRTGSSSTLYIGAFHVGTGASVVGDSYWIGRLYFFKVWYGDYSRILVPARRKSDGVLGLYDAAGSGFYPNISSNGQLKAGQNVDKTGATFYENGKILSREILEI